MIYIVSGYRRSGTTMMMQALHAGGLPVIAAPHMDRMNFEHEGYAPNPGRLMEVGQSYYKRPSFLRLLADSHEDSCVKIFFDGLCYLPSGNWTVIYMHRDPGEIQMSLQRADKYREDVGIKRRNPDFEVWDVFRPYNQQAIDHVLGICRNRLDVMLLELEYKRVIESPIDVFEELAALGVPIDPVKAAAVVDPKHYRSRNEHSEGGSEGVSSEGKNRAGQEAPGSR